MRKKSDYTTKDVDRYFELWKDYLNQGMNFGEALKEAQKVLKNKIKFRRHTRSKKR